MGERCFLAALYFVQISVAYLCMLIAMTYQVELFISVCAGLAAGHALFGLGPGSGIGNGSRHQPCCATETSGVHASDHRDVEMSQALMEMSQVHFVRQDTPEAPLPKYRERAGSPTRWQDRPKPQE